MEKLTILDPRLKPDPNECPLSYCFHFRTPDGRCGLPCVRVLGKQGDGDWYESNERKLRPDGLPWFYFFPSPEKVAASHRAEYVAESEALWGKEHWKSDAAETGEP